MPGTALPADTYASLEAALIEQGRFTPPVTIEDMLTNNWTVNQWRAARNLPPTPWGDRLLAVPTDTA